MSDFSYADVVEQLFREFDGHLPLPTVVEVVHQCLADLQGQAPPGALAELLPGVGPATPERPVIRGSRRPPDPKPLGWLRPAGQTLPAFPPDMLRVCRG
ncbi:hypothetical protein [Nakamurella sp. PAMC28650]|uniref:hypothetical protein n=1 Tax=Nakamurella sp. PAMC28650 TaxID=2762325 RepID=UPI00164D7016|nr:hypothetical protein [Nakamurella sp. PAMC28650]QNK82854.1 hypothetical protein H7F38_09380 [Nakamurella sp. PAMC28650]